MEENNNKGTKLKIIIGVVVLIVILTMVITYISPVTMVFIAITVAVAAILTLLVLKFYGDGNRDDNEEESIGDYIDDVSDLDEIRRVINLPIPYGVISDQKKVLLFNKKFTELFDQDAVGEDVGNLIPNFDENETRKTVIISDMFFDVYCSKIVNMEKQKFVYSVCLIDVNERETLKKTHEGERIVTGMIFIDNLDNVVESLSDFHLSILKAKIDQRLGDYVLEHGGILKKFEKDRYLYITNVKSLEGIKEKKFDILNEIKEIKVKDNHIPLTLSIGIGVSYKSLEGSLDNAKDALDLALGRGGDQALIKDGDKYLFYGGKSVEMSHNARIRARVKAEALQMMIANSEEVLVMGHKIPDFDSIGASIGIYRIATDLGKKCRIVMDNPSKAIMTLYDILLNDPNYSEMFVTGTKALELMNDKTLLVVVDTYVTYMVENEDVLENAKEVVVFDHHRKSKDYIEKAVLTYHEPYASSTSELVTEVIRQIDDEPNLRHVEADSLLAGIAVDTKNFGVKAGAITFEAAAYLRRKGADTTRVKLMFKNELEFVKVRAKTVENVEIYKDIAISVCDYGKDGANIIASQAADELLNVVGIKAAAVIYSMNEAIFISSRSYGDVNVQLLLEKIGGGGHQTMAGTKFTDITIDDAVNKLKTAIDEYLEEEN